MMFSIDYDDFLGEDPLTMAFWGHVARLSSHNERFRVNLINRFIHLISVSCDNLWLSRTISASFFLPLDLAVFGMWRHR